jgi:N-acetylmuramic acid 6-phosphate etherase
MKAGTAQKLVLNMLTTASMIKLGKVLGNLMVDVQSTNLKLIERAKRIVVMATGVSRTTAEKALAEANGSAKVAITMLLANIPASCAAELLLNNKGMVRAAINSAAKE